jgi:Cu+-exporting ATPase
MIYTCPMHPEIEQDHPGECPKCGMTLEPKTIGPEEEEQRETRSLSRKFWIALVLTIPSPRCTSAVKSTRPAESI